jgi:hypothetical protein
MRFLTAPLLALALGACATHTVRQSTLFAPPSAGAPATSHGRFDAFAGGTGVTYVETRSRPATSESGSYLARGQTDYQLAARIGRFFSVRAEGATAFAEGATAPDPTTLERPSGIAGWVGPIVGLGWATEDDPFFFHAEIGSLVGIYPSVLLVTDIERGGTTREEHLSTMPIVHGAISAGYWVAPEVALSAGFVFRNQPRRLATTTAFAVVERASASISFGNLAAVPWIAMEIELERTVGFVMQIQLPITGDVVLGPAITLGMRAVITPPERQPRGSLLLDDPE